MLSHVLDIVQAACASVPFGNHSFFQKLWYGETRSMVSETLELSETPPHEKEKAHAFLDTVTASLSLFTKYATNPKWSELSVEERLVKVKEIQEAPQIPQRSEEWYRNFGKVLTASEFSAIFSFTKRRKDLILKKANPPHEQPMFRHACPTMEMNALGWGIRFEPVVKQLLEHIDSSSIYEPGRLQHPLNPYLAASPDGIIETGKNPSQIGRLVEIKCPYTRTTGGEIPSEYWIQMQVQMEVTDIDECEYIECEIVSPRANQDEPLDLSGVELQGCMYLFKEKKPEGEPFDYKYLYGDIGKSIQPKAPQGYECIEVIPWGFKRWHRKVVHRDRGWYEATKPWQEAFWKDVESVRQGGAISDQAPAPKPRSCLIQDD